MKGLRPISLLTMLYRIWSRARKQLAAEWCDAMAGFWDDGVRGSSPLQAALRQWVADELTQHTDNQETCTVRFDVESFHDSISLSLVARAGLKLAYSQFYWVWHSHKQEVDSSPQGAADSAKELSSEVVCKRDALKATTLRDWRSTTFCRDRMSCIHPPRLRNGWMTLHSERNLRRARWSTRRLRRRCSWCGTYKRTSWRLLPSQWFFATTPNIATQVVGGKTNEKVRKWTSKQASARLRKREPGRTNPMVRRLWVRRQRGSSKRGRGLLKHNAEVEEGV